MFAYKIVIYLGLIFGIVFLITSGVIFVRLHILDIFADTLGLSSKKKIQKVHSGIDKNTSNHFNPQMHEIKNIKDISISHKLNNMNTYSSDLTDSNKLDSENINSQATALLYDEVETEILNDDLQTDILDEYNTEDLEAETEALEDRDNSEIKAKNIYFKVVTNKLVINTYEIIN